MIRPTTRAPWLGAAVAAGATGSLGGTLGAGYGAAVGLGHPPTWPFAVIEGTLIGGFAAAPLGVVLGVLVLVGSAARDGWAAHR